MKFSNKLRLQREAKGISQEKLAADLGMSRGSIGNYEQGLNYPRSPKTYIRLSEYFGVDKNYFRTEDDENDGDAERAEYLDHVKSLYGKRGADQAEALLEQAAALFAGGDLTEEEEIAFLQQMQRLFLDSKVRAKKFTPRKHMRANEKSDGNDMTSGQ